MQSAKKIKVPLRYCEINEAVVEFHGFEISSKHLGIRRNDLDVSIWSYWLEYEKADWTFC